MKKLTLVLLLTILCISALMAESQWAPTNGPMASKVKCSLILPTGEIYMGSEMNGLYKSTDNGSTWVCLIDELEEQSIYDLALDSSGCILASGYFGLYKSCGSGWEKILMKSVKSLGVHPNGTIFVGVGSNTGLIISTDGGANWVDCVLESGTNSINIQYIAANGDIYAGADGMPVFGENYFMCNLYKSTDVGNTWERIGSLKGIFLNALAVNSQGIVLAGSGWGLYRSQSPFSEWDSLETGFEMPLAMTVNTNDEFVGCFYNNLSYKSADNGNSWVQLSDDKLKGIVGNIRIDPNGNLYCTCNGFGLKRYNESSKKWEVFANNLSRAQIISLGTNKTNLLLAGTDNGDIYYSFDEGNEWLISETGLEPYIGKIYCSPSSRIYASAYYTSLTNANFYYSNNQGKDWTKIPFFENNKVIDVFESASGKLFVSSGNGLYASADDGENWEQIGDGLDGAIINCSIVDADGTIFAGTTMKGLYRSTNHGVSWECINTSSIDSMYIRTMAMSSNGSIIAGPLYGGLYVSHDKGTTWTKVTNGFTGTFPQMIDISNDGSVFVLDFYKGLFKSTDNGDSWSLYKESEGQLEYAISGVLYKGTTVFATMPYQGGVFKTGLETNSVLDLNKSLSNRVFPNPADDYLEIILADEMIDTKTQIFFRIYNSIGEIVNEAYGNFVNNSIRLDIYYLKSGVYFASIGNKSYKFVKKDK